MGAGLSGKGLLIAWPTELAKSFEQGNLERILTSIAIAKSRGATLRVGPELEIPYVAAPVCLSRVKIILQRVRMPGSLSGGLFIFQDVGSNADTCSPGDTVLHSWEVLAKILASEETMGIVCDVGMYVPHPSLVMAALIYL